MWTILNCQDDTKTYSESKIFVHIFRFICDLVKHKRTKNGFLTGAQNNRQQIVDAIIL